MKILIINWRSLKDPLSGGAEQVTFEHAKRWVSKHNAEVIWLSPRYDRKIHSEILSGVKFVYIGNAIHGSSLEQLIKYVLFCGLVFFKYLSSFRRRVDLVIDQVHGLPFMTPLYVREKIIVYIHEVAGEIWNKMYTFPFNLLGRMSELVLFRFYKNVTCVTVSEGTKKDLVKTGIPENKIFVVYNGADFPEIDLDAAMRAKLKIPTIMYIGRLVRMKGIERALEIFALLKGRLGSVNFWIVGSCEEVYLAHLKDLCNSYKITENTTFFGYLPDRDKFELLRQATWFLNASYKEGWGLVNIEANSQGTPAISFPVPGNVESISHGVSGFLEESAEKIVDRIVSTKVDESLISNCILHAKKFEWGKQSDEFYSIINEQ